ncbi:hypothetical protein ACIGFJ_06745 [Brevundimonas diminuta]|uniref:hypothetical protein n=1 Tax=Brevundimonas diminuta TaxID=293 RepID=UPI0037CBDF1A
MRQGLFEGLVLSVGQAAAIADLQAQAEFIDHWANATQGEAEASCSFGVGHGFSYHSTLQAQIRISGVMLADP